MATPTGMLADAHRNRSASKNTSKASRHRATESYRSPQLPATGEGGQFADALLQILPLAIFLVALVDDCAGGTLDGDQLGQIGGVLADLGEIGIAGVNPQQHRY